MSTLSLESFPAGLRAAFPWPTLMTTIANSRW
jgi:hypothetical protein